MGEKPAGWYYVGEGQLRYRDEWGWTAFVMDAGDPRARNWPPPTPRTALQQARDAETLQPTQKSRKRFKIAGLFGARPRC